VILLENKLFRIASITKHIRKPHDKQPQQIFDTYEQQFSELVELCEDYWDIIRIESFLFCTLPSRMFNKQDVLEPISKSFNLKMIVISVLGYLISNHDYSFQEAHLTYLTYQIH
jgi:hypothetical protein